MESRSPVLHINSLPSDSPGKSNWSKEFGKRTRGWSKWRSWYYNHKYSPRRYENSEHGTFLVVWCLSLHASTVEDRSLVPHAMGMAKRKKRRKGECNSEKATRLMFWPSSGSWVSNSGKGMWGEDTDRDFHGWSISLAQTESTPRVLVKLPPSPFFLVN